MEKLIYINSLGREIEFSRVGTYRLRDIGGLGGISSSFMRTSSPFQDGATSLDNGYFETRLLSIEFVVISDRLADDIRNLNSIFNPKLGAGTIKYQKDDVVRTLRGVKTKVLPELPMGKDKGISFQISSVILECFDPYYLDENDTHSTLASQYDLFIFDAAIPDDFTFDQSGAFGLNILNQGDVPAPVTVIIDGPLTSPIKVENKTTGEKILIAMSIASGERITITTDPENIDVRKTVIASGIETSAFQYIDILNTTFFMLATGTNNLVFTHGTEIAQIVTLLHKNKYVGV
jgi:hypothetical protein